MADMRTARGAGTAIWPGCPHVLACSCPTCWLLWAPHAPLQPCQAFRRVSPPAPCRVAFQLSTYWMRRTKAACHAWTATTPTSSWWTMGPTGGMGWKSP